VQQPPGAGRGHGEAAGDAAPVGGVVVGVGHDGAGALPAQDGPAVAAQLAGVHAATTQAQELLALQKVH